LHQGTNGQSVRASFNTLKNTYVYENTATPKNIREAFDFDNYGNETQDFKFGQVEGDNLGVGNDELRIYTEYAYNEAAWVLDRPIHIRKTALDPSQVVAEHRLFYDGSDWIGLPYGQVTRGNLTRQEERLGPNGSGGAPCPDVQTERCINSVRRQYDGHGNVIGIMDGSGDPGQLGQGHYRTLLYDARFHTFPEQEQVHLDGNGILAAGAIYDAGFGTMTEYRDFNAQVTRYHFDQFGRLDKVIKPGDTDQRPTVSYTYHLDSPVSYLETNQRQRSGADDTIDSRDYVDGLGRKLQTKLRAEGGRYVVQQAATFDARMRVKESYLPYFAAESTFEYVPVETGAPKITSAYDATGRELEKHHPDGSVSTTVYTPLQKIVADEENNDPSSIHYNKPKTFTRDGLDRLVQVDERNGNGLYTTAYGYDPLGNLTQTIDSEGNPTGLTYDGLGRMVGVSDPDRGTIQFTYSSTGRLETSTDAKSQTIQYAYDGADRVMTETFIVPGRGPEIHASYHYDAERPADLPPDHPTLSNTLGRLVYVEDLTGESVFSYDPRGHISVDTRKIGTIFYSTFFTYDAAERLSGLTYPDPTLSQEQRLNVGYQFNQRGLLSSAPGFASQISYRASGQIESIVYANQVLSTRGYDVRNRLEILTTTSPSETPSIIQDLRYEHDRTGNLLTVTDRRPGVSGEMNSTECFSYDDLYRLLRVDGHCGERSYYIDFDYSPSGNLTYKASDRSEVNLGRLRYGEQAGPHALTTAGPRRLRYDANGNLSADDGIAAYDWDAKDRLSRAVPMAGPATDFSYDYAGARVAKRTGTGEVLYINRYAEVRNGQLIKYVFAGNHRLAQVDFQGQTAFNHADRLGSSSLVTESDGRISGRIEYYAFGQERLRTGSSWLPYTYTDKERDGETNFDYFGARYYESTLGRFISLDPWGAAFRPENPQTLNRYAYTLNNPLRYVDPDGRYERDVHRDLTTVLATAVGFDQRTATAIGNADQGVDDDSRTNPFASVEARRQYHFTTIERRMELWNAFMESGSIRDLGRYLHAEQDSYSHEGFGAIFGHLFAGHTPDRTYSDPAKADRMALDTYEALRTAADRLRSDKTARVEWSKIEVLVTEFNRAQRAEDKAEILDQVRRVVDVTQAEKKERPEQKP